jgi:PucR family transcriptional regulator, purine catabolism regulatory protein
MPPTLASLVRAPALRLTVLAGRGRLDAPVRWVHTSELADPTPFLEGGELLLTTGMAFGPDPQALRGYVHRLADAGVVGLGVGVGLTHERVPGPLVEAAAERRLPLLEVPQPTPFIAISKAVSAALAAEQYQEVTATYEAQQEFTRAALGRDGAAALLRRLAHRLDGWAALYDAAGLVLHAAPRWAASRAERLTGEVARMRERPAPSGAAVQDPGGGQATDYVELQSLGAGRRPRGFLAVGTGRRLTAGERYVVHSAAALLTLTLERSRALQRGEERLRGALLRMLVAGEAEHARAVAGELHGGLLDPGSTVRLLIAEAEPGPAKEPARGPTATPQPRPPGDPGGPAQQPATKEPGTPQDLPTTNTDPLTALADLLEATAARTGEPALVVHDGPRLTALVADAGAVHRACTEQAEHADRPGRGPGPVATGVSAAVTPDRVPAAHAQAERALAVARRRRRALVRHDDVGAGSVLPLLGDDAVRAFADGLLRPLREHDATSRGDLEASLHAWLSRHGQWDAAAADLGVHRHTLRYRMRRVEELLGRSLDDADVRMELWLALRLCATPGDPF